MSPCVLDERLVRAWRSSQCSFVETGPKKLSVATKCETSPAVRSQSSFRIAHSYLKASSEPNANLILSRTVNTVDSDARCSTKTSVPLSIWTTLSVDRTKWEVASLANAAEFAAFTARTPIGKQ